MSANTFTLRFEYDPATDLPHLVDSDGRLPPQAHAALQTELKSRCNKQTLRAGETIHLPMLVKNLPSCYRVRAEPGLSNRMPTYVLEPADPILAQHSGHDSTTPSERDADHCALSQVSVEKPAQSLLNDCAWTSAFLVDADDLMHELTTDRLGRHGLEFVLEELRDIAKNQPRELVLLLLSSYAAVAKLSCAGGPDQSRRESFYDCALEAMNPALGAVALPAKSGSFGVLIGAVSRRLGFKTHC